ncbi:MAG: carbonic anhydrase [Lachnospiraceae bacterium]|nr:carbonic anhydrase [Lachnospiraceae bacterium]
MEELYTVTWQEALEFLKTGNKRYLLTGEPDMDASEKLRRRLVSDGQHPKAVVIACSDSRVVPEAVFGCSLGDIFTIRTAGNVIDSHQLGSIEYAVGHLHTSLVVLMGHTHCGAVGAAMHQDSIGHIKPITDEIKAAIGTETDDVNASWLNVRWGVRKIQDVLEGREDVKVIGAMYDIETGEVTFEEE